jgi:hypothetical protein
MPDNHNSPQRNWARQVSKDFAQSAHDPQKALGYAGHVAGEQNWAAKVGLDFGRPENQSKHRRAVNQ